MRVEFLRVQVGSECVATYSGRLAAARLFIVWQQQQQSSEKLFSCMCLSRVPGTLALVYFGVCLGLGMWQAYSSS